MNRRDFLSAAAGVTLTAAAAAKDDPKMAPVIDTHQHLWDLTKIRLSWVKQGDPLNQSFTPTDYAAASEGLNVVKAVYMEVDVVEADLQKEADYVLDLIKSKKSPTVAAVLGGRPNKGDEFQKWVAQFKGSPHVRGLRQVVHTEHTPPGYSTTREFVAGIRHLGEIGLSWDICQRPADLGDAAKLVGECPDTRFILDHCGNAPILDPKGMERWKKDIAAVAAHKNVVGKVSGIIVQVKKGDWSADQLAPAINHTIEVFGWDRVMWAGDWPVCTLGALLKDWLAAARQIVQDKGADQQRKLFHDNAAKFYGL